MDKNTAFHSTHRFALLLIFALLGCPWAFAGEDPAAAAAWPRFHGPNMDNLSTETGLLAQWPAGGPPLLWTARGIGFGYTTVAIDDGILYTAGNKDNKTLITALSLSGKILWQVPNGEAWKKSYPGTRGTPTLDGGRLYHESPVGDVICLDAGTGKKIWSVNIVKKYKSELPRWALAESLLILDGKVICCPGGGETCMAALDKQTGRVIWTAESIQQKAGYASPVPVTVDGLRIIVTLTAKAMIGVNARTGKRLWSVPHLSAYDENIMTPVIRDGCIFISTVAGGSAKWRIHVEGQQARVEELWRSRELDNHHGGVILVGNALYGASCTFNKEKWICLDWESGAMRYADKGVGKGALTFAEGMLYTVSRRGKVGLVRATPEKHAIISTFDLPKGGEGNVWAHPVICGGRLYIRHGDLLHAFAIQKP